MTRLVRVLGALAGVGTALHAQAAAPSSPLAIAVEDSADPWSRPDGTGFANEIVRSAFGAAGVPVTLSIVPYARCKRLVIEGQTVACFSMSRAVDLAATVRFPGMPLFTCRTELLHNPAHPLHARRLQELPPNTVVGIVLGYEYPPDIARALHDGSLRVTQVTSEEVLLRMLSAGRVEAALVNVNATRPLPYLMARAGVTGGVASLGALGELASNLGFSVRHPRGAWALAQFEAGMRRIAANGTRDRIERAWADSSRSARATQHAAKRTTLTRRGA